MWSVARIQKIPKCISTECPLWNIYCDRYWATTGSTYTRDINHKCSFTGPTEMTGAKFWVCNNRMICNSVVSHSRDGRELHYSRHGLLHWCKLCLPQTCRVNTVSCFTCTHHWYVKQFVCSIVELANGMSDFIHPQQWGMSGHPCESLPICWLCCALKLTGSIKQKRHHFQFNGQPKIPNKRTWSATPQNIISDVRDGVGL